MENNTFINSMSALYTTFNGKCKKLDVNREISTGDYFFFSIFDAELLDLYLMRPGKLPFQRSHFLSHIIRILVSY